MSSESFWKFKLRLGRALLAFMAIPLAILLVIPVRLWVGWADIENQVFRASRTDRAGFGPKLGETGQQTPGLGPVAIIKFHAENFKIESLAGHDAMHHDGAMAGMGENSGHVHVTVDDNSWYWVHSNSDPIVIAGLSAGPHKVTLELVGAGHKPLNPPAKQVLNFTMAGK